MAAITSCGARLGGAAGCGSARAATGAWTRPAEHGGLGERHGAGRLAEIALRRRLDAIGAGAEIDPVQVELEDLVLGVVALQPERQDRLLDLARGGALLGQEQVLGELLGQRRAALRDAAPRVRLLHDRAGDADRVDAEMLVEAPVLDRHEGLAADRAAAP